MKVNTRFACLITAVAFAAASARAGEIPIDISSLVNAPWIFSGPCGDFILNGDTFPTGSQNFGGVPFAIPTGPSNTWLGAVAADCGAGKVSLTVPVGAQGVTSVFTLLNSMWGAFGPRAYLFVTFTGSQGASLTVPLVGNVNVRDYNNDGGDNSINNTSTVQVWTNGENQRLDRQEYILPAAFATQVLTSVTITDTGNEPTASIASRAIFSGLTVSTCPATVAEGLTVSSGTITYDPSLKVYVQDVTLTNARTTAVNGPLFFILEDLPSGVTLVGKSAATACLAPVGSRYLVPLPEGSSLAPGTNLVLKLAFSDPTGTAISYTPLVAGSLGGTP
jgi:hypothetical protein